MAAIAKAGWHTRNCKAWREIATQQHNELFKKKKTNGKQEGKRGSMGEGSGFRSRGWAGET